MMRRTVIIALLLLASCSVAMERHTVTAESWLMTNLATRDSFRIQASITWTDPPEVVCTTCRGLYTKPLPPCRVRIAGRIRGRSSLGWFDIWDGFRDKTGNHGVRCYEPGVDCRKYPLGAMAVVTGRTQIRGRLETVESVEIIY